VIINPTKSNTTPKYNKKFSSGLGKKNNIVNPKNQRINIK
jgi:hypothetical protein